MWHNLLQALEILCCILNCSSTITRSAYYKKAPYKKQHSLKESLSRSKPSQSELQDVKRFTHSPFTHTDILLLRGAEGWFYYRLAQDLIPYPTPPPFQVLIRAESVKRSCALPISRQQTLAFQTLHVHSARYRIHNHISSQDISCTLSGAK